jgi:P-type E1-E2 ATPase
LLKVITGDNLKSIEQSKLDETLSSYSELVFARTTPDQKLMIVEACQRLKEIVAVTGDGSDDSQALKKADIGIAMGISGTDIAKESADITLLDDNFASIQVAIEEGRLIFENLRKSISYTLSTQIVEISPFLLHIAVDIPLPLCIVSILYIDLITAVFPPISLAFEKTESILKEKNLAAYRLANKQLVNLKYLYFRLSILI